MKAFLCCLLIFSGISLAYSQSPPPGSDPSSSIVDTSHTAVMAVASIQPDPAGSGLHSSLVNQPGQVLSGEHHATGDNGPIRDWSNPPGFLGFTQGDVSTSKRRPMEVKKYQRIKTYRCYTF